MRIKTRFFKKDPGNKKFGYRKWHTPIGEGFYHADEYAGKRIYETNYLFTMPFFEVRFTTAPHICR